MIAGLQKKFILISAVSTLAVFSVIFLLLVLFSWDQMEKTMDTLTDAIVSNDGVFPDFDPDDRRSPAQRLPYTDAIASWAYDGVSKVYQAGIMTGASATAFNASGTYTTEQSIVTMVRLSDWLRGEQG